MPVAKLKNLVILILALANVLLLSLLIPRQMEQNARQMELRESLVQLCQAQNVILSPDAVPETVELYALELADAEAAKAVALEALLGYAPQENESGVLISADSLRLGTWREQQISLKLQGLGDVSNMAAGSKKLLESMGFDLYTLDSGRRLSPGIYAYTAHQAVLGVPVFSDGLKLTYGNNAVIAIEGDFYAGTLTRVDDTACISAAEAVVAFLEARVEQGWVGSAIMELEQGYAPAGDRRLTPVWMVVTDTGSFCVDGLTAQVSTQ